LVRLFSLCKKLKPRAAIRESENSATNNRKTSAKLVRNYRKKVTPPRHMSNNINKIIGIKKFLRWTWWHGSDPLPQGGCRWAATPDPGPKAGGETKPKANRKISAKLPKKIPHRDKYNKEYQRDMLLEKNAQISASGNPTGAGRYSRKPKIGNQRQVPKKKQLVKQSSQGGTMLAHDNIFSGDNLLTGQFRKINQRVAVPLFFEDRSSAVLLVLSCRKPGMPLQKNRQPVPG
jgi:hypothetical protein